MKGRTAGMRLSVLVVLMIGPVIASAIALFGQRWDDPDWIVVVGVCGIGWLVSVVVGCLFWILRPQGRA